MGSTTGPLVKGRALLDAVDALRARFGEATLQETFAKLAPEVRQQVDGALLASDWYPLDALTGLIEASYGTMDAAAEERLIARSENVIARHLGGVYQLFVRLGSPEWIIKRIAAVHVTYFRNVEISPSFQGERRATVRYVGFEPQHRVMEFMILGFYRKALELSGAKEREVRITVPIAAGKDYLEVALSW